MKKISIDPITRLEGHGRVDIFLNDEGEVENTYFVIPELRGFEKFAEGRPVEEMARITPRICGVCPEAHHMCATKAADAVYHVDPPEAAKRVREAFYNYFYCSDHATHFYALGAPDFVMGPDAPVAERNILGIIHKVGLEIGGRVIQHLAETHHAVGIIGGKDIHPIAGIPGGWSKPISKEEQEELERIARNAIEFGQFSLKLFADVVLANQGYVDLILSDAFTLPSYSMGLVDANNLSNFYDGMIRVVDPDGNEFVKYAPHEYRDVLAEKVLPYTYLKYPYLKKVGWKGFVGGKDSGVYRATPLSRCNAADGMATPLAQEAYEQMYETLTGDRSGRKPIHQTLACHWARLVEMLYSAERALELVTHPDFCDPNVRTFPTATPDEGVATVEAPRGTLTHHYWTDERGVVTKANLIVGTTNNYAPITISINKAARAVIRKGVEITEGILNRIEMAFRSYDPCFGCATHSLPGQMPLEVRLYDANGELLQVAKQYVD
jgi:F420-non-reducing hydrogenase large subunit